MSHLTATTSEGKRPNIVWLHHQTEGCNGVLDRTITYDALLDAFDTKPFPDGVMEGTISTMFNDRVLNVHRRLRSRSDLFRARAQEASCADFGVGVWDFNPKPE
jgi:hypothetical protein